MIGTDYDYYIKTLTEEIPQFFTLYTDYHADYFAHEIPGAFFSYPLCIPVDDYAGIEYVQQYLRAICYENIFCKCFPEEAMHHVLTNQCDNNVVFNLCEQVLHNFC